MEKIDDIQALLRAQEFQPFGLKLKHSGELLRVVGRDYAWVRPLSSVVHVVADGKLYLVSAHDIEYIETPEKGVEAQP